jgi:predicted DNA-binding transcriptional regulator YafY
MFTEDEAKAIAVGVRMLAHRPSGIAEGSRLYGQVSSPKPMT